MAHIHAHNYAHVGIRMYNYFLEDSVTPFAFKMRRLLSVRSTTSGGQIVDAGAGDPYWTPPTERIYCVGDMPTWRAKAVLNVLAEP